MTTFICDASNERETRSGKCCRRRESVCQCQSRVAREARKTSRQQFFGSLFSHHLWSECYDIAFGRLGEGWKQAEQAKHFIARGDGKVVDIFQQKIIIWSSGSRGSAEISWFLVKFFSCFW
jgi:hypothetical protein